MRAQAAKLTIPHAHQMPARVTIKCPACASGKIDHRPELIALHAIGTAHRLRKRTRTTALEFVLAVPQAFCPAEEYPNIVTPV
jgi:hypothetical protein